MVVWRVVEQVANKAGARVACTAKNCEGGHRAERLNAAQCLFVDGPSRVSRGRHHGGKDIARSRWFNIAPRVEWHDPPAEFRDLRLVGYRKS